MLKTNIPANFGVGGINNVYVISYKTNTLHLHHQILLIYIINNVLAVKETNTYNHSIVLWSIYFEPNTTIKVLLLSLKGFFYDMCSLRDLAGTATISEMEDEERLDVNQ